MTDIDSLIQDFKDNIPVHLNYECIKNYKFTKKDKEMIQDYIKKLEPWINRNYYLTRDYIGELARDRYNENYQGLPIIEYD